MKRLQSKRLRTTSCSSMSAVRGKWRFGCPGRSAAMILHEPTNGVDKWARCPAHERCTLEARSLKRVAQSVQDVYLETLR